MLHIRLNGVNVHNGIECSTLKSKLNTHHWGLYAFTYSYSDKYKKWRYHWEMCNYWLHYSKLISLRETVWKLLRNFQCWIGVFFGKLVRCWFVLFIYIYWFKFVQTHSTRACGIILWILSLALEIANTFGAAPKRV